MNVQETGIPGVLILQPRVFEDPRGSFFESYNKMAFAKIGVDAEFVQDNQSQSMKDVLRRLHVQLPPYTQGKLVRVITGAVLNAAVDLRKASPAYGKHVLVELTAENKRALWIPPGCANGFRTLTDGAIYCYKVTAYWNKESERTILWNDPDLGINWGIAHPLLNEKDQSGIAWRDFQNPF